MNEIPLHQIDNFILLLKFSHGEGFTAAKKNIMQPLRQFFGAKSNDFREEIIENLQKQRKLKQWRIVANLYKKVFHYYCYEEDHNLLFTWLNSFLLDLQQHASLRKATFSYEFFRAFEWSLNNLQAIVTKQVLHNLDGIFNSNEDLTVQLPPPLTKDQKDSLNEEARKLYNNIELAYARADEARLSYYLAQFTGRFCNYPEVAFRDKVDLIIEKVSQNNAGFRNEVRARLAVRIFQAIAQAAERGDIKTAVRGITTYVITFQDDLTLPYRKDLDLIEENLYKFIEKNNLWHRVKLPRQTKANSESGTSERV